MTFFQTFGRRLGGTLAALAFALSVGSAAAQGFDPHQVVRVQILPGWQESDGTRIAALRVDLAEGWHTYWRIPGDAGIAPTLDWRRSQNVARVQPVWPRPSLYDQGGMRSFVYHGTLILPLHVTPADPSRPVALFGDLTLGVCADLCVPVDLHVQGALSGAGAADGQITASLRSAARPAAGAGLGRVTCQLEPAERGATLTLRARIADLGRDEVVALEMPGAALWFSTTQTWREGGDLVARAQVRAPRGQQITINRQQLEFTLLSDRAMVQGQGCVGG